MLLSLLHINASKTYIHTYILFFTSPMETFYHSQCRSTCHLTHSDISHLKVYPFTAPPREFGVTWGPIHHTLPILLNDEEDSIWEKCESTQ